MQIEYAVANYVAFDGTKFKSEEELEHDRIIADYYRQQELGEHCGHGDVDE